MEVKLIDPRPAFASRARFPDIDCEVGWPGDTLAAYGLDRLSAVVTLTHNADFDDEAIIEALKSEAFYIGCLGSQRTAAKRNARLCECGIGDAQIERLHGPVGLDIGAASPAEIAVSICAQLIATHRLGGGRR